MQDFNGFLAESDRLMGLDLKSQKTIEMCILIADKYETSPDETREIMKSTPFSYAAIKDLTDKLTRLR